MKKGLIFLVFMTGLLLVGCSGKSDISEFPSKPIKLMVVFPPGGGTDNQARIISEYAQKYLDEELVIVNKPGGGGRVGWNEFTQVKPDGYALAAYNLPHIISQPLVGSTSYHTKDFEPIVNWGGDPTVFAVKKGSNIQNLEDLIKRSKQNPDSITIGHSGKYVGQHLAILQLENAVGIQLKDVAFGGSSEANASLLGGHIDVISGNLSGITRLGDQVRPLAIATEKRHEYAPDIPTFKELGYSNVIMSTDRGIAARKGTPDEVIAKLEKAFMELLEDKQFQAEMRKAGAGTLIMDRKETIKEIEERKEEYEKLLKTIGVLD